MMRKTIVQNYLDRGILIVKTHINGIEIQNPLIYLGEAINIMSKQTMDQLKLPFRPGSNSPKAEKLIRTDYSIGRLLLYTLGVIVQFISR